MRSEPEPQERSSVVDCMLIVVTFTIFVYLRYHPPPHVKDAIENANVAIMMFLIVMVFLGPWTYDFVNIIAITFIGCRIGTLFPNNDLVLVLLVSLSFYRFLVAVIMYVQEMDLFGQLLVAFLVVLSVPIIP